MAEAPKIETKVRHSFEMNDEVGYTIRFIAGLICIALILIFA